MKTTVHLSYALFDRAERAAKLLYISRSQLYAHALEYYLKRYDPEMVTAAFNAVYAVKSLASGPASGELQEPKLAENSEDEW